LKGDSTTQDEIHLYGSSRLGIIRPDRLLSLDRQYGDTSGTISLLGTWRGKVFRRGLKLFELSNHLGNVLVTVSDKKLQVTTNGTSISYYNADVMTANDYYPFGMVMPNRRFSTGSGYRYGFNGQEKSAEINSDGNSTNAEFWQYDARLGRRWNMDPVCKEYESPYSTFGNNPIWNIDVDGSDTTKYLSNSQLLDAVKTARSLAQESAKSNVKSEDYYNKDVKDRIDESVSNYGKHGGFKLTGAYKEFLQTVHQYYAAYGYIFTINHERLAEDDLSLNNPKLTDAWKVGIQKYTISLYEKRWRQMIGTAAGYTAIMLSYFPVDKLHISGQGPVRGVSLSEVQAFRKTGSI
jgi:RHS repeat-associated protein